MLPESSLVTLITPVRHTSSNPTQPEGSGRLPTGRQDRSPAALSLRYPTAGEANEATRSTNPVRVVVADDHRLLREAVRHILEAEGDLRVVGEAADGNETVAVASATLPDVVLLDFDMPARRAADTVSAVLAVSPTTHVIVLTMHDNADFVQQMLDAGASGYLHKSVSSKDLILTVAGVAARDRNDLVTISVSRQTASRQPASGLGAGAAEDGSDRGASRLSRREAEVLELVAVAFSNRQIATRLSITEGTVKRHLRNIFDKLGAVSRIDAVNKARPGGLLEHQTGVLTSFSPNGSDQDS